MPKLRYGAVITDSRGSMDGVTYSKNKGGSFARKRSVPTNKLTSYNSVIRARQATLSKRWSSTLSAAQRTGWGTLANANPVTDVFGNTRYLSGFQFYCRVNGVRGQCGLAFLDAAPADQAGTALTSITMTATVVPVVSVVFAATPLDADHRLYIFATPPHSNGKTNVTGLLKFVSKSGVSQASPYTFTADYTSRFGNPITGRSITFRVTTERDTRGVLLPSILQTVAV